MGIYAVLIAANLSAWAWALIAFAHQPILLGTALLAYSLGLRHALDADHIAAIDNVTRKLMQEGERPAAVGLFFSLGHSTIVVLASVFLGLGIGIIGSGLTLIRLRLQLRRQTKEAEALRKELEAAKGEEAAEP